MSHVRLHRALLVCATVLVALFGLPASAQAIPFTVTGASTGSLSTAEGDLTLAGGTLTITIKNTSPFDARITGLGFDLFGGDFTGNHSAGLNGFFPAGGAGLFVFRDGALSNVPQFSGVVLDFGWTTGPSGNFNGGHPNSGLAPGETLVFSVTGGFAGLSEADITEAMYIRFQRVGEKGNDSDVGRGTPGTTVPEPATVLLLGAGLAVCGRRLRRRLTAR